MYTTTKGHDNGQAFEFKPGITGGLTLVGQSVLAWALGILRVSDLLLTCLPTSMFVYVYVDMDVYRRVRVRVRVRVL